MRLPALTHLLESTLALSHPDRICVLGSSALLASFPALGEPGQPLEVSYDADLLVEPCDEQLAAMLHEAVGEGSLFAQRTGYHADFLRPGITETLPPGWDQRLIAVAGVGRSSALAPQDLACVKLRVGRAKDLELCRHLIVDGLLTAAAIRARIDTMSLDDTETVRVYRRLREVST